MSSLTVACPYELRENRASRRIRECAENVVQAALEVSSLLSPSGYIAAELTLLIPGLVLGGVRQLAHHSVADEGAGTRLLRRGHVARFRGGSVARRRRAAG